MTDPFQIQLAQSRDEIAAGYGVMTQLRPHLTEEAFVAQVLRQQAHGFRLAYLHAGGAVKAAAGFRVEEMLHRGQSLYVDDLVTSEDSRSKGYGHHLMEWLKDYARQHGYVRLDLDSGVQRSEAHRFYFREGLVISSYHFFIDL